MNACSTGSGPKRVKSTAGAFVRSALIHATLCSTALLSQTLEKAIPYASVYSDVDGPLFLAVDSTTNTVYVASDCGEDILAIDGATHRRKANIPFGDEWCCALFSVPGQSRVYCVGDTLAAALDTRTNTVVAQFAIPGDDEYLGGGANPKAGKVYLAYEDVLTAVDAQTSRILRRIRVGFVETDDDDRMPFASNTVNGKVYLVAYDEERDIDRLVVVDCAGDSVLARVNLSRNAYVDAMYYDNVNNVVWCAVEDTCSLLLGVDGKSDSVVAAVRLDEDPCVMAMCFADDVNKLYLTDDDGCVTTFDPANRRVLGRFWVADCLWAACVNPREHKLYCGCDDGLAVYDTRDDSWVGEVGGIEEALALALNQAANEVWCVDDCLNTATAIDCGRDSVEAVISTYSELTAVCLDANADRLYVSGLAPGSVNVLDVGRDTLLIPYQVGPDIDAMCLNPAERRLFCASGENREVVVLDLSTGQLCHKLAANCPEFLVFDSAGSKVYCVESYGESTYVFAGDGSSRLASFPLGANTWAVFFDPFSAVCTARPAATKASPWLIATGTVWSRC